MNRRVVITGLGLVTPVGIGVEQTWEALCAGKSGVGEITHFDASAYPTRIAAEVKDFNPQDFMPKKDARRVEPFIAFALAACRMAFWDSGWRGHVVSTRTSWSQAKSPVISWQFTATI